jgi:hypothetical protein
MATKQTLRLRRLGSRRPRRNRLTSLMINHEVGVNARVLKIPNIDSDYFDEEGLGNRPGRI